MAQHAQEERIRERARRLWEEEGQPEGRADDHWREAERQVMLEEGLGEPQVDRPEPSKDARPEPQPEPPADPLPSAGQGLTPA
jgi:hypothetical protein